MTPSGTPLRSLIWHCRRHIAQCCIRSILVGPRLRCRCQATQNAADPLLHTPLCSKGSKLCLQIRGLPAPTPPSVFSTFGRRHFVVSLVAAPLSPPGAIVTLTALPFPRELWSNPLVLILLVLTVAMIRRFNACLHYDSALGFPNT